MKNPKQTVRDLRKQNRKAVLRRLIFDGPTTRTDLSQLTGLSPASVNNIVAELLAQGILTQTGREETDIGRPRITVAINPTYGYLIGVTAADTFVCCELFDLTLKNVATVTQILANTSPQQVVKVISTGLEQLLIESGVPAAKTIGMGIGVPGVVRHGDQVTVHIPTWNWSDVPLKAMLAGCIHFPIALDNGAKAMAQAEYHIAGQREPEDTAVLLIGNGIGAGIIANRSLYRGSTNSAGECGHMKIVVDGRPCRCGSQGCLEAYAGASGILATLRGISPQHPILNGQHSQKQAIAALVQAAKDNDPAALKTLQETAHYLGIGMANIVNLFNPQELVLGGWAGLLIGELVLPELRSQVNRYAMSTALQGTSIHVSRLGSDAEGVGAAILALEDFFETAGRSAMKERVATPIRR